jgi:hypothetical protein
VQNLKILESFLHFYEQVRSGNECFGASQINQAHTQEYPTSLSNAFKAQALPGAAIILLTFPQKNCTIPSSTNATGCSAQYHRFLPHAHGCPSLVCTIECITPLIPNTRNAFRNLVNAVRLLIPKICLIISAA